MYCSGAVRFWLVWSYLVWFGLVGLVGSVFSGLVWFGKTWFSSVQSGSVWSGWSFICSFGLVWSGLFHSVMVWLISFHSDLVLIYFVRQANGLDESKRSGEDRSFCLPGIIRRCFFSRVKKAQADSERFLMRAAFRARRYRGGCGPARVRPFRSRPARCR